MSAAEKITSDTIRGALQARYPAPEYAVLFEVTDATGAQNTRSADAVIMSCWPSRGLELHGVEIKVSRADWMHERRQPKKAETIAAYCDRWWLVTGPGVIQDIVEIPPAWGWAEYAPATSDLVGGRKPARLVTRKEPALTEAKAIDRLFLASVLRNAAKVGEGLIRRAVREAKEEADAAVEKRVDDRLAARSGRASQIMAQVEGFEAATGIKLDAPDSYSWMTEASGRELGRMVMAARCARLHDYTGLQSLYAAMAAMGEQMEIHADALGIEVGKTKPFKRRK